MDIELMIAWFWEESSFCYESTMYICDSSFDMDISSVIIHITESDECDWTTSEIDIIVDGDISTDDYDGSLGFSMDTTSIKYIIIRYIKILIFYNEGIYIIVDISMSKWMIFFSISREEFGLFADTIDQSDTGLCAAESIARSS